MDPKLKLMALYMIKKQEGVRHHVYECTEGYATIGAGRNISKFGIGLRDSEIDFMLANDIEFFNEKLEEHYQWFPWLTRERKFALISMAFQLGMKGFSKFVKMLKAFRESDFDKASTEMLLSTWANQTPNRAMQLAQIIRTGVME